MNRQTYIYIGVAAVILIILIGIYLMGKSSNKQKIGTKPLPLATPWGLASGITQAEATLIRQYTNHLHSDMEGWNATHDEPLYLNYLGEPERIFIGVYNDFNDLHGQEGGGTLYSWIDDEYFGTGFSGDTDILTRMNNLNLTA